MWAAPQACLQVADRVEHWHSAWPWRAQAPHPCGLRPSAQSVNVISIRRRYGRK
jgi:hypothetical protein